MSTMIVNRYFLIFSIYKRLFAAVDMPKGDLRRFRSQLSNIIIRLRLTQVEFASADRSSFPDPYNGTKGRASDPLD